MNWHKKHEYVERQEWAAEQAMAVIKEKNAEIERLRTAFVAISRAKDAYRIMLDEKIEENERLRAAIMRYKSTLAGTALLNFEKHFAKLREVGDE